MYLISSSLRISSGATNEARDHISFYLYRVDGRGRHSSLAFWHCTTRYGLFIVLFGQRKGIITHCSSLSEQW